MRFRITAILWLMAWVAISLTYYRFVRLINPNFLWWGAMGVSFAINALLMILVYDLWTYPTDHLPPERKTEPLDSMIDWQEDGT